MKRINPKTLRDLADIIEEQENTRLSLLDETNQYCYAVIPLDIVKKLTYSQAIEHLERCNYAAIVVKLTKKQTVGRAKMLANVTDKAHKWHLKTVKCGKVNADGLVLIHNGTSKDYLHISKLEYL